MLFFCSLLKEHEAETSTPKRTRSLLEKFNDAEEGEAERRGGKHNLTPSSKIAISQGKRFEVRCEFYVCVLCSIEMFL